ncbi:MAG TPA: HAMP domain-containing sensor histidine kinase [Pseudonocardiaceae bacterium]|nr:HAMP domain-containing sensor histidine kinase [Pseudonocardiaceae bacterium]
MWPSRRARAANTDAECQVVRRAQRLLSVQIAAVITLLVVLVGAMAYVIMVNSQRADADREVSRIAAAPSTATLYGCDWLFISRAGAITTTSGSTTSRPPGLPVVADLSQVARTGTQNLGQVSMNGTEYTVLTEKQGANLVQAVYDQRYQLVDRRSLLLGLELAELVGLVVAVAAGFFLAGRAISPLVEALGRQRRFVADASHELRAPLTQLHTRAQLLARRTRRDGGPDEVVEELDRLVAGTRRLGEVVEDLLLSARLRAQPQQLAPVDLGALVREAAAAEAVHARCQGLTIEVNAEARSYPVDGVASALGRVVTALIDNAVGHTDAGGRITLTLREITGGREVELTVVDSGVGFDPQDANRIFERFARGDVGTGRRFGLGLALVREVVTSHNGSIAASSEPGAGATFTVRLPVSQPTATTARQTATPVIRQAATPAVRQAGAPAVRQAATPSAMVPAVDPLTPGPRFGDTRPAEPV